MAVDGRKLRDTLRLGSEDWIEFPCSPCEKDGKNVASVKHCVECGENLCKTCLSCHEKFTRGHQIVENPRAKIEQKKPELPVQRCDKHGGKLVDVYCPSHDTVGCATCVAVDHRYKFYFRFLFYFRNLKMLIDQFVLIKYINVKENFRTQFH
jgi:hypothetical protein